MPYANIRQISDIAHGRKTQKQIEEEEKEKEKKRNKSFLKLGDIFKSINPLVKRAGGGGKLPK